LYLLMNEGQLSRQQAVKQLAEMSSDQVAEFLRSRSAEQLLDFFPNWSLGMYHFEQLFLDGSVLPKDGLLAALKDPKRHAQVPVITGTNRDEAKLFLMMDDQ